MMMKKYVDVYELLEVLEEMKLSVDEKLEKVINEGCRSNLVGYYTAVQNVIKTINDMKYIEIRF